MPGELTKTQKHNNIITNEGYDVDEDLMAENVDIEFAGDVADEFHEHVLVRHLQQFAFRLAQT